ncbi:MAG: S4 domain-containing protein [Polaromonas sp.]|nr:S4 domain-containing protein [Polaromonas sp.]
MRLDKWLWAARFYKTRSLATEEIGKGRVQVNSIEAKPARDIKAGDTVQLRQGPVTRTILIRALSQQRGAAPVAQQLYEETPDSVRQREAAAEQRRLNNEPATSIEHGRPTKRDRRSMDKAKDKGWNERWSASSD